MRKCSICQSTEVYEDSPILIMGAYGVPKYLCDACAEDMECATGGREYAEVETAIERLGERLAEGKADALALRAASELLTRAARRCAAIKSGGYDFSLDESADTEELSDIPEELKETEEDKELARQESEQAEKANKIMDRVTLGIIIAIVGFVIYRVLDALLF